MKIWSTTYCDGLRGSASSESEGLRWQNRGFLQEIIHKDPIVQAPAHDDRRILSKHALLHHQLGGGYILGTSECDRGRTRSSVVNLEVASDGVDYKLVRIRRHVDIPPGEILVLRTVYI